MPSINNPVSKLHLVDQKAANALKHLGIQTIYDLLYYFPRDWQDLSQIQTISEIRPNEKFSIRAKIKTFSQFRSPRRRMHITQALLEDSTGNIQAIWFNQPFLKNSLQAGREYYFSGKATIYDTLQLQNPTFELVKAQTIHTAGIVPIYELTEGVTQKQLRYWQKQSLEAAADIADFLPRTIRTRLGFVELTTAVQNIHFPGNPEALLKARLKLAFDELFLFQLALQSYKHKLKLLKAPVISLNTNLVKKFVASLPFRLTASQRIAAWEILKDLKNPYPMNRLLEGEVGSGKTVVAGIAMLEVAKASWQSVLLSPTEILAWQHYQTLKELFKGTNLEIAILTRSHKDVHNSPFTPSFSPPPFLPHQWGGTKGGDKRGEGELLTDISSGRVKIIIGTHALLQEHVKFQRIGLLVIDEQHRFGVSQRAALTRGQTLIPHLLSMTATPIPRTLALAFYGDLDISELRELPHGRKQVITKLVPREKRQAAYDFVRKEIEKGRQAYVVVPLVGENSPELPLSPSFPPEADPPLAETKEGVGGSSDVKAATVEAKKLTKLFPEFRIGLLHGRLPGEEKKQIMQDFKSGKIHILVSTTVIEVGVDVPNATIMWVENAERFGLAQLHQLRGRVGRSSLQSYCLLFAEDPGETTRQRLQAVVQSTDGFELAEKDLELRGPGEVMGTRQSGYIPFKIAKLSDRKLIKLARDEAQDLLKKDSLLTQFPLLRQKVEALARDAHLE